jgi:hypothetical protein
MPKIIKKINIEYLLNHIKHELIDATIKLFDNLIKIYMNNNLLCNIKIEN